MSELPHLRNFQKTFEVSEMNFKCLADLRKPYQSIPVESRKKSAIKLFVESTNLLGFVNLSQSIWERLWILNTKRFLPWCEYNLKISKIFQGYYSNKTNIFIYFQPIFISRPFREEFLLLGICFKIFKSRYRIPITYWGNV